MKTTTGHRITPEIKAYSDAVKVCGDYSIANPTCSLKNNPHEPLIAPLHRKATGSVNILLWCPGCSHLTPRINDRLLTECCGSATVNFNDHRPPSKRR